MTPSHKCRYLSPAHEYRTILHRRQVRARLTYMNTHGLRQEFEQSSLTRRNTAVSQTEYMDTIARKK